MHNKENDSGILILTRCNHMVGTGHLRRSVLLQSNLLKLKINCEIWTNTSSETNEILKGLNSQGEIKHSKKTSLKIQDYRNFRLVILDISWNDPWLDINRLSLTRLIEEMDKLNIRVIYIGRPPLDTSSLRSFIDIYPDGTKVKVSGNVSPRYIALRKEFYLARSNKNNDNLFNGSIFLTMGGTDPFNMLRSAVEQIADCAFVNQVKILVSGDSHTDLNLISELLAKQNKKCTVLKNVGAKKIIDTITECDITVTAFGTTAFESMSLGSPIIAVTHYAHQDKSAKWFSDLETINYMGCAEQGIDWKSLKNKLDYLYNNQKIAKNLGDRASAYVDGEGLRRTTNHIKEIYDETFDNLDDFFIFAHPGTEALVAAGVISKLVDSGKNVGIAVIGDGINSRLKSSSIIKESSELHINLEKSFEESCSALGVKVKYIFRYPDNEFDSQPLLSYVNIIEAILDRHKPIRVWTHLDSGINIDHKVVNKAVMIAARPISDSKPCTVFGFRTPGSDDWSFSNPIIAADNWFEEVDLKSERRINSYLAYDKINYFPHKLYSIESIDSQLRVNGEKIGVVAAESFCLIRNLEKK